MLWFRTILRRMKVVEYYDSRAALLAFDSMRDKVFQQSTLDMRFIWDDPEITRRDKRVGPDDRRDRRRSEGNRDRDRDRDRARSPDRTYVRGEGMVLELTPRLRYIPLNISSYLLIAPTGPPENDEKLMRAKEIERVSRKHWYDLPLQSLILISSTPYSSSIRSAIPLPVPDLLVLLHHTDHLLRRTLTILLLHLRHRPRSL